MIKFASSIDDMRQAIKIRICYIAGPISGEELYKENFLSAEWTLEKQGIGVFNPSHNPSGLEYDDYFPVCYSMIAKSGAICLLDRYEKSNGVGQELKFAKRQQKEYWVYTLRQLDEYTDFVERIKYIPEKEVISETGKVANEIRAEAEKLAKHIEKINPEPTELQKQNEKVKNTLRSYLYCQHQINTLADDIDRLDSARKRITVQFREVHGGNGNDYTEKVIEEIEGLENKIIDESKKLESERKKVQFCIDGIDEYRERIILNKKYIADKSFEEIAEELGYELRYVKKIHNWGIEKIRVKFYDFLKKDTF